jgi:hypothetical protein
MKTIHRCASDIVDAHALVSSRARARVVPPLALAALGLVAAGACGKSAPAIPQTGDAMTLTLLGTAQRFAVLGGSTVTNTGATTVDGNLGVAPGLAVTGFPPGLVTDGSIHAGDAVALQAQHDTITAYNALAGEAVTVDLTGQDLGGMTLVAGVYHFSSSAQLTGALSLDAQGDPNAVFVFQIGSTLTTASESSVVVLNGATDCNVFWQVGSSATLGTTTAFKGSLLALTSITLNTGAKVIGRALARNAAVTMDANDVSMSTCAASSDAGMGEGIVPDNDSASASDTSPETSSGGDSASAFNGDSSVGSDSGGSSSDSGSDSGGSSSGADASSDSSSSSSGGGSVPEAGVTIESGTDASEAGESLCCGGVLCGTSCTNLSGDNSNCGSCGNVCASDQSCIGGECQACSPVCGEVCTDFSSDHANCGSCGNACLASETCTNGVCAVCSTLCAGACADLAWDEPNCGSCGNACLVSEVCFNGVCQTCSTLCAGACTDLTTDQRNCGSCGNACAPGDSCVSSACVCQ